MIRSRLPQSSLPQANLNGRRVFLRADLDVRLVQGKIADDFRLKALSPTLQLLITKGAKIILATHIGRPKEHDPNLSTHALIHWYQERGYPIQFAADLEEAQTKSLTIPSGTILLLENLRFYKAEQESSEEFAFKLHNLADYYVNDAFALLHRMDTSITLLPALYEPPNKTIGLLVERELEELNKLSSPKRPFVVIIGGGKVHDKLPFIEKLIERADTLIILPALAFTFLKSLGTAVGLSLVDESALPTMQNILTKAEKRGVKIILPIDYLVCLDTPQGPVTEVSHIPPNGIAVAVGRKSLALFKNELEKAKSIFFNGAMGLFERPETLWPLKELLQTIAQMNAFSIIGGGESVAAVYLYNLENRISFCSTGGGASLYYLCHGNFPSLTCAGLF